VRGDATWTPQRLAWISTLMAWDEGQTLAARFEHACGASQQMHAHWRLGTSYSGFADALVRSAPALFGAVAKRLRRMMIERGGDYFIVRGWRAFGVDGTRIEAPHTAANEAGLGCAGREKTAPQVFLTTLWHLGLGLPWSYRCGPGTDSERVHAQELINDLPPQSLMVADAGFVSYGLCKELRDQGHSFLLRVGGNVHLLAELGYYHEEREDIVYLWPDKQQSQSPLVLRLIVLTCGEQTVYLVTDVLEPERLSDEDARQFYAWRWGEEVYHRSFKQTLDRRKLLSRTPATCLAEAQAIVLGTWLLGLMSMLSEQQPTCNPRTWSVARSRDAVRRAMRDQHPQGRRAKTRTMLKKILAQAVADSYVRQGSKTARNYPRKKKEKPPGAPKIKTATPPEIQRAKKFPPPITDLRRTA
jgi:Transposase DDE domain